MGPGGLTPAAGKPDKDAHQGTPALWLNAAGRWVDVHIVTILPGTTDRWPSVVMYRDADSDRSLVCVGLHDEVTRSSRFRSR